MTHFGPIVMGVSFTCLGLVMRKQQKKNWKAFLFGGVAVLLFVFFRLLYWANATESARRPRLGTGRAGVCNAPKPMSKPGKTWQDLGNLIPWADAVTMRNRFDGKIRLATFAATATGIGPPLPSTQIL